MLYSLNKFLKQKFSDNYEKAINQRHNFILKFSNGINIEYLKEICNDKNNKIYLYTINDFITDNYKNEIIGIAVVRTILNNNTKIRIYIPLITIHKEMRSFGYGTIILEEIIQKFNKKNIFEIVLLSLQTSYDFYEKLGFIKSNVKFIEKKENIKDCIMMIKTIINNQK
jgi:N-acetylglutamate synthase-like GNAT family acetyltransferase